MKRILPSIVLVLAGLSCDAQSPNEDLEPGTLVPVAAQTSPAAQALLAEIALSEAWTVDDFTAAYPTQFEATLNYDPISALNLDLIATSSFALSEPEITKLGADGFVLTGHHFPSFVYGYSTIYMEDLPVFVSADSILFAMHRSYDAMLRDIELQKLTAALTTLIDAMRASLVQGNAQGLTANQETDLDIYLAVAGTLANTTPRPAVVGADQRLIDELVDKANEAKGSELRTLFGAERRVDWSQFKPRGHYAGIEELERYFRAMMWLGRIDFRMLEPNEENQLILRRRQLYNTLALANLLDETATTQFDLIHTTVGAFVGEPDGLVVTQVPQLMEALGVDNVTAVKTLSDDAISTAIQKHGFGGQRIASHYMINGLDSTKPLSHSFALMSQRYVLDSHVFSNVVWDRTKQKRMMPNPLDVAFAALANDQAGALLEPELRDFDYQHQLNTMRVLADAHEPDFWGANLYNGWLGALRTLSPSQAPTASVAGTEAWGRRLLNTQLASWAELRHDTILYAKQSYTTGAACEYPDAYVEPNPAFFAAIGDYARSGQLAVAPHGSNYVEYFDRLEAAATRLEAMATAQEAGTPHGADDLAWINEAVATIDNCDETLLGAEGWYGQLFYGSGEMDFDPTIADVHTQPTDATGVEVGRVLHVGTGNAQAMVVTVETCEGPRAYVGLASTYYEAVTENFERLTDEDWAAIVNTNTLVPPQWAP